MASKDLNIVDRGTSGSSWVAEDTCLTAAHLDEVMEQKTDNSCALNSLPTPFARFFVAKEAFRRAMEEHINSTKEAGFAYRQMVSDILDVYELIFNYKYHCNTWRRGQKLELRQWNCASNFKKMQQDMPVLYNSINEYYKDDIKEPNLYFVVFTEDGKDKLLGCTSPMTGFITPPDLDKYVIKENNVSKTEIVGKQYKELHIYRKSGGEYFRDIKMFEDRDADFKNYMYNNIFNSGNVPAEFKEIKEYVRSFKHDPDIRQNYGLNLTAMRTDQNTNLVVNGITISISDEIDIHSYFTDSLIKVPYRIARDKFTVVKYKNDIAERDYDYLLPFKPEVVGLYEDGKIDSELEIHRNSVTVYLRYNGREYKKEYAEGTFSEGQGKIVNLNKDSLNFDLGLFPNILSAKESENNYFKVMVMAADEDPAPPYFNIDEINLRFFKNQKLLSEIDPTYEGVKYGMLKPYVRSVQKTEDKEAGTKFYELFNTYFDLIEVKLLNATGLILPKWEKAADTDESFTYAIDLGTSNTFISRCKDGESYLPEMFKLKRPMVNYLHEIPDDEQLSYNKRVENSTFDMARPRVKTEFLPSMIDGQDYKFPIRTALCGIQKKGDEIRLFDNHNIAFFYEKFMATDDQKIFTDIKWDNEDELLKVFVKELLLMIKFDILQRDGDLSKTKLVWFKPLSFMGQTRSMYEDMWRTLAAEVLGISKSQISCFSESEAPYYYFKKKDYIKNSDAVTVIDIGGGSTDFVYFQDNQPKMANSVHFGCDVLWGNGFVEFENAEKNGIYLKYKNEIKFKREDLENLNVSLQRVDTVKTKEVINFWLSNAGNCDIMKRMNSDFKPVFVYHLTMILFYMASMYKEYGLDAPKTVIFSGNGSKYVDGFISSDQRVLKKILELVFKRVYGRENTIHIELPEERKEATCYGGLYRDSYAEDVPEKVYQGDLSENYKTVGDITRNYDKLKLELMGKYEICTSLYKEVLDLLKQERIIDTTTDTKKYVEMAKEDMEVPLKTYFKTQVKEKYQDEEIELNDSVFFLPVINRVVELTNI